MGVETVESRKSGGNKVKWLFTNNTDKNIDIRLEFAYNKKKPLRNGMPYWSESETHQVVGLDNLPPTTAGTNPGRVRAKTKGNWGWGDEMWTYKLRIREYPSGP